MAYIDLIVSSINTTLKLTLNQFKEKVHGVADHIPFEDEKAPLMIDAVGNEFTIIDDRYEVVIFHMSEGTSYPPSDNSFGDGDDDYSATTSMQLYAWLSKSTQLNNRRAVDLIIAALPSSITLANQGEKGIFNTLIELKDSNSNSLDVFTNLYGGLEYSVRPEDCLINVTYEISSEINRTCFAACANC